MFISIEKDAKDKTYRDLIDFAFEACDTFILVVRKSMFFNQNVDYLLEELKYSLIEVKDQWDWPGTFLAGGAPGQIYYYNTDNKAREIIKTVTSSLHSWVHPDLPEDLSFIKNGKPWLINTSHEFESYIITENKEEIDKITQIKGLSIRCIYR
ncbi:stage III sporulation protein AH [Clostridium sp. FP2]|uniref:stage III sporulation protein AH n=1 Tax=Clostridium sp. FP2 TaxID=2724481 RepID=UPI0016525AA1|nr:stage III sporulation protein AH [Clostridium sp. FP2]MBZ9626413.1 stage III sporulation protein AH [Clostridium sp. FP2]